MQKPISKNIHGLIDYTYGLAVPLLPEVVGFKAEGPAKILCRTLGIGAITYSLLTEAKWGVYSLLPFRKHLLIDAAVSLFAITSPWLLRFSRNEIARNTLIGIGAAGLAAALMTDPVEHDGRENAYLFI